MQRTALLTVTVTFLFVVNPCAAQIAPTGIGFKEEYLAELSVAEDHLVRLAEVIPTELYTWRPTEGVRSVSEVFLHVAGSNFNLPRVLGVVPREGMVNRDYATSTTDKAEVVAALKEFFVFVRNGVEKLTETDAEKTVPWFDGQNTYRGVLYFMARHTGEHTGQVIAYARMNGVVPPWSE